MAGHETTLPITLDQMIYHASSVVRAVKRALVVVDLPFGSYQGNSKSALESSIAWFWQTTQRSTRPISRARASSAGSFSISDGSTANAGATSASTRAPGVREERRLGAGVIPIGCGCRASSDVWRDVSSATILLVMRVTIEYCVV